MSVKKVVKKISAKKIVKSSSRVARPRVATTEHVSEVFTTRPQETERVEVPANSVQLFVNGRDRGVVNTSNQTLGEFAVYHAQQQGIKSFSLYADGAKMDTGDAKKSLAQISKVEIVTKDARGRYHKNPRGGFTWVLES